MKKIKHLQHNLTWKRSLLRIIFLISLSGFMLNTEGQNINKLFIEGPSGISINSYTGSCNYARNEFIIPGRGELPLDISFRYNSLMTGIDYGFGPGWMISYSIYCNKIDSTKVNIIWQDAEEWVYLNVSGTYLPPKGIFDSLIEYTPGKFQLTKKNGTKYFFDDSSHHGVTKIRDRNANEINLAYTSGKLSTITDPSGRAINLSYTNGHLTQLVDPNNSPSRSITIHYDASANPDYSINVMGDSVKYQYDNMHNLNKVIDEEGYVFDVAYNSCMNVSGIVTPVNTMTVIMDTALKTTTTSMTVSGVVQSTTYKYDNSENIIEQIGNCCGYHTLYAYDVDKNVIQKTDAMNYVTNYTYDNKGNRLEETDPVGDKIIYTYGAFSNVVQVKDKKNNITNYTYDVNGNLLQVNKPLGITENYSYNSYGNPITYTDGRGNTTQYSYNNNGYNTSVLLPGGATRSAVFDNVGNKISTTDCNLNITTYEYNKANLLTQTTNPLMQSTSYTYDKRNNLVSTINPLMQSTSYSYDALSRLTSTTTPAGTSYLSYNEKGNVVVSTDNKGYITIYSYNTQNLKSSETNPLGHSRYFTYAPNGNRLTETDYSGNLTTNVFDSLNRLKTRTDALGNQTTFTYDKNGNPTSIKDANNNSTTYTYNALNKLTQVQNPIGSIAYSYDGAFNITSITDANMHTTTNVYDSRNRITSSMDPLMHSTNYTYDAEGNNTGLTDKNGHTITMLYDALGRLTSTSYPLGLTETKTYNAVGNIISNTIPNGNIYTYIYDSNNRLISKADLIGIVESYTYDANSNVLTKTDALNHTTSYSYNAMNKPISISDPYSNITAYTYNNNLNVTSETDRRGNITAYVYDNLERKIKTINPLGDTSTISYNTIGKVSSRKDDNGNATTYTYDLNNRLITETFANSSSVNYAYDTKGNRISRIDQNGNETIYSYDANDRLVNRNYPGSNDDNFTFDNEGKLLTANNMNANIAFTYDNADQILAETMNSRTTSYSYNIPAKFKIITYPGGREIKEQYDGRARMLSVQEGSTTIASFNYDGANRTLTRTYNNGIVANYTYNNNDWLTSVNHLGSANVAHFNYTFDNDGYRLAEEKVHHTDASEKYLYDASNKLVNFKSGTLISGNIPSPITQHQLNYDGTGNRTSTDLNAVTTNYTVNTINQYTSITGIVAPTYDANGNMLSDGAHAYLYDYENRLISVDGGATAAYLYDALGRRIEKQLSSGVIEYFYDGQNLIEERTNGGNSVIASYVYGADIDNVLTMKRGGNIHYYYHHNALGSVAAITNNSGNLVERYEYDAYGKPTIYNNAYSILSTTTIGNTFMFTDREYDAETGNYYYRARNYHPTLGRFMQQDPIGNWGDIGNNGNAFTYVGNNPVNRIDPMGLRAYETAGDRYMYNCMKDAFNNIRGCTSVGTLSGLVDCLGLVISPVTLAFQALACAGGSLFGIISKGNQRDGNSSNQYDITAVKYPVGEINSKIAYASFNQTNAINPKSEMQKGRMYIMAASINTTRSNIKDKATIAVGYPNPKPRWPKEFPCPYPSTSPYPSSNSFLSEQFVTNEYTNNYDRSHNCAAGDGIPGVQVGLKKKPHGEDPPPSPPPPEKGLFETIMDWFGGK
jgi:RHS repeat-associated protein